MNYSEDKPTTEARRWGTTYVVFSLRDTVTQLKVEMLHGAARLLLEEASPVGRDREVHLLRRRGEVKLERVKRRVQSGVGSLCSSLQFAITRDLVCSSSGMRSHSYK